MRAVALALAAAIGASVAGVAPIGAAAASADAAAEAGPQGFAAAVADASGAGSGAAASGAGAASSGAGTSSAGGAAAEPALEQAGAGRSPDGRGGIAPAPDGLRLPAPVVRGGGEADGAGRVQSLFGLLALIGIGWLLSADRTRIDWRLVAAGTGLQLVFGLIVLRTEPGRSFFSAMNDAIVGLLGFTREGTTFLFRSLVDGQVSPAVVNFAFNVLPTIVFFSSLMAVLYHVGAMQRLVRSIAWVMQRTMRSSGAETLAAAGNIFLGQTEAPLLVRPYVEKMTRSELFTVMVAGMATVAGGVMAAYVGLLRERFPDIAGHLLAASVLSAPAALVFAKLLLPEREKPLTAGELELAHERIDANAIDAAARGASEGLQLALNVAAMLLAFIALIAVCNAGIGWLGQLGGIEGLTFQRIAGVLFWPFAWLMGVPASECLAVGELLGEKIVLNEFVAYAHLGELLRQPETALSYRAVTISTYALCGFSNFASIAIQIGGIGSIAPSRRKDVATLGLRSVAAGSLACFMTAAVAGILL